MAVTYTRLASTTIGATPSGGIEFANIPQTYTHLKVLYSARSNRGGFPDEILVYTNNFTSMTSRSIGSGGSSVGTYYGGHPYYIINVIGIPSTVFQNNYFGTGEITFYNYRDTSIKHGISVTFNTDDNSSSYGGGAMDASFEDTTGAITTIGLAARSAAFIQYTTFWLYGIKVT